MNLERIWVIGINVFWEVIRDRILYLVGLFGIAIVVISRLLPDIAASTEDKILIDVGLAMISVLGLIVTIFIGTGLVNKEIEKRTILVLLAKPVSRAEFIFGKQVGLSLVLAILLLAMTGIFVGVLQLNQIPYPIVPLLVAILYIFFELILMTAVTLLMGVFTTSLIAILLSLAIFLMGRSSQDLVAFGKLSKTPAIQQIADTLFLVLPDLSRFNLINQAAYGYLPDTQTLLLNAGYGLLYTLLVLGLGIIVFSRRQF